MASPFGAVPPPDKALRRTRINAAAIPGDRLALPSVIAGPHIEELRRIRAAHLQRKLSLRSSAF